MLHFEHVGPSLFIYDPNGWTHTVYLIIHDVHVPSGSIRLHFPGLSIGGSNALSEKMCQPFTEGLHEWYVCLYTCETRALCANTLAEPC